MNNQMEIIKIIVKLNPKISVSDAGKAYNAFKKLQERSNV